MKIGEIAREAALLLDRREAFSSLSSAEPPAGNEAKADAERLIAAANRAVRTLALSVPLVRDEAVRTDGTVLFSSLSLPCIRVEEVYSASGDKLAFRSVPDGIRTESGTVTVRYRYLPPERGKDEECDYREGAVTRETLAAGAAAEYALAAGRYEEAELFAERFRTGGRAAGRGRAYLPARRWI